MRVIDSGISASAAALLYGSVRSLNIQTDTSTYSHTYVCRSVLPKHITHYASLHTKHITHHASTHTKHTHTPHMMQAYTQSTTCLRCAEMLSTWFVSTSSISRCQHHASDVLVVCDTLRSYEFASTTPISAFRIRFGVHYHVMFLLSFWGPLPRVSVEPLRFLLGVHYHVRVWKDHFIQLYVKLYYFVVRVKLWCQGRL